MILKRLFCFVSFILIKIISSSEHNDLHVGEVTNGNYLRELDDENFERLTQASTGSTTGDWFILFYLSTCKQSMKTMKELIKLSNELTNILNVGIIDVEKNPMVLKRFNIIAVPSLRFFKNNRIYTYMGIKNNDIMKSYVLNKEYLKSPNESVPEPFSFIDLVIYEFNTMWIDILRLYKLAPLVTIVLLFAGFIFGFVTYFLLSRICHFLFRHLVTNDDYKFNVSNQPTNKVSKTPVRACKSIEEKKVNQKSISTNKKNIENKNKNITCDIEKDSDDEKEQEQKQEQNNKQVKSAQDEPQTIKTSKSKAKSSSNKIDNEGTSVRRSTRLKRTNVC